MRSREEYKLNMYSFFLFLYKKLILLLCTVPNLAIPGITREDAEKKPAAFKVYNFTKGESSKTFIFDLMKSAILSCSLLISSLMQDEPLQLEV